MKPRFLFLLIAALFTASLFLLVPKLLQIKKIQCYSQYGECSQNLIDRLNECDQKDFYTSKKKINEVFSDYSLVGEYVVRYKIPDTFDVYIIEKKPLYGIKAEEDSIALVNDDSEVISHESYSNLPVLHISENLPEVGSLVDQKTKFALDILYDLYSIYQTKEGYIDNGSLIVDLKGSINVIFPLEGDREVLLGSLVIIRNQLNGENGGIKIDDPKTTISSIDLRYKNPVVK